MKSYFWLNVIMGACSLCFTSFTARAAEQPSIEPLTITYPYIVEDMKEELNSYFLEILALGLDKANATFTLKPISMPSFVESRSEYFLRQGRYALHWLNSSPEREQQLLPVRIPLMKGLIGWRIFFIQKGQQLRFSKIKTLDELRSLTAGQVSSWSDTPILLANHFQVQTSPHWENLFLMQEQGRIHFYPRSIIEVWQEEAMFESLNLTVESSLAIHYPSAYYFFVSPDQQELAKTLEKGLQIALDDGSFDRIFYSHFSEKIERANLTSRRTFELSNPHQDFPDNPKYWYRPTLKNAHRQVEKMNLTNGDANP